IARVDEECINALLTLEYLSLLSQVIPNEKNTEIIYGQVTHYDASKLPKRYNRNAKANSCTVEESCEGTTSNRDDKGQGSANKILMDNFLGHMKQLHNKELLLTSAESQKFTKMLLERQRLSTNLELNTYPRWKCFIKGISTTHVIITILPASEKDVVRLFASTSSTEERSTSNNSERNSESVVFNVDLSESQNNACSKSSTTDVNATDTASIENNETAFYDQCVEDSVTNADTQRRSHDCEESLVIPVYVYDCSLALLIDTLVDKLKISHNKDIYQDHTFRVGQQECKDFIELKSDCNSKPSTPEPKSEDSDNTASDQRSLVEHCKQLSLAHCHCYVVAVYKSLVLQQPLTYDDMEAAVEQCEETLIEINITNYLRSVCRHLSKLSDRNLLDELNPSVCNDVEPLHNLIKEKFERIITVAFRPVPAHPEFYYCSPSCEDEIENLMLHSINIDSTTRILNGKGNVTWPGRNVNNISKISRHGSADSVNSDLQQKSIFGREQPLFLQLSCSVRFQSRSGLSSIPVKSLPTCFMEIVQKMEDYKDEDIANLNLADLKITLDIICLNLPREVLEISLERYSGLRATSFCSGSPVGSLRTESGSSLENNAKNELFQEKMSHLPLCQHNAISNLKDEIEWLLQDETATAFLDQPIINKDVLNFVANHVSESTGKFSCKVEKVPLYFVYPSDDSKPKFISDAPENLNQEKLQESMSSCTEKNNLNIRFKSQESHSDSIDLTRENQNTEDGCKESNTSENRFQWLIDLDNRKSSLPNFWLILNVENDFVNVYFHCRFLEIISPEVNSYWHTQKMLVSQIKSTCRRVNQYLLLQNLHKTSKCSELLETESSEDYNWKSETTSEFSNVAANRDSMQNFTPGMFRCRVVWKFTFRLHPRLKTGPGRSGLSRGIKALHGVLNRFAVSNRSNMFVYQENNKNVFYLRLHEQISDGKALQNKLSESDEQLVVSRSNSVVSLSQVKLNDNAATNDTRPRVRSFSEKESNTLNKTEDSIILMVHGISDAGPEVKRDLVQVLQNRLDDAVLEVLSVMLARNPMCKLTPADVHFIQPPKSPESIIRLSVQKHCTRYITALEFYLRQNILQFLYIPKYTDNRPEYHFQDYSQREGSTKRISESDIFLYNQSHSSGSKGIACIALAIAGEHGEPVRSLENEFSKDSFPETVNVEDFKSIVSTSICDKNSTESPPLIEFKIWKQGRVNLESLLQKLCSAVKHAIWDLVTEYKFLSTPLTEPLVEGTQEISAEKKENQTRVMHDLAIDRFEAGEEGKLHSIYCVTLSQWFRFALEIGVPSVKRHEIILTHRHPISTIITELEALIQSQAPDTSSRAFVLKDRQPFIERYISNEELLTGLKKNNYSVLENEGKLDLPVYIPCDFSKDVQGTYTKCVLIARNFHQWKASKASFSSTVQPELLIPKGIFHHRPSLSREHANSQYLQIMDMESLMKFSAVPHNDGKDWTRLNSRMQNIKHNQFSWNEVIGQTMRDVKPNNYFHSNMDPTVKAICDLQDLRSRERKVKGISLYQQLSQQMQKNQNEQTNIIKWHKELCSLMLSEYKQYLHSLGFSSVQIESSDKSFEGTIQQQQSYYLKKSMLGGVLLFEIHLSQPFFIVKLHIIECSRLQTKASSALVNQFMLSFVDACDKIKISMHLHSFTYDFHLRCIHSYIAGTGPWLVQQGYHLIHFLDDFNKYYSKAPNYARNLIYSNVVTIRDLAISGRTLYSYLLSHEKTYNMRVFVMKSDLQDSEESEYVLVSLKSTPLISYCDAQDTKYADDFDVVLIVSHLEQPPQLEKTEITLKYYLMLTSKRELYPKKEVENNKLGKFRTVYSVEKSICTYTEPVVSTLNESSSDLQESRQVSNDKKSDAKLYSANFGTHCNNTGAPTPPPVPNSPLTQNVNPPSISLNSSPHLIQIRQESINYLGYYSSHEQLMQQTIMSQANTARMHIMNMIKRGALQCRTHLLWNKLSESKSAMNYNEFSELCSLAHVEPLLNLDPRLRPFINQPISWYQSLSKVLQNKYQEHHKQFNTPDGNITHLLILHPSFFQVFMMLTIDLHASRGVCINIFVVVYIPHV
ncbi:Protein SZT2, partial [Melipona quadrifasciata]